MLPQRRGLVADLLRRHLWLQVQRVGAKSAAGVAEARGANLQSPAVIASVSGHGYVGETVFLQDLGIGGIGGRRIRAALRRTLHLPTGKLLRKKRGRRGLRRTGGGIHRETRTRRQNRDRQSEKSSWKTHWSVLVFEKRHSESRCSRKCSRNPFAY